MKNANKKTDAQLLADVQAELSWDPSIKADDVSVRVKDGVVTLGGHTTTFADKWHAGCAAQRVSGVASLVSEIKVELAKAKVGTTPKWPAMPRSRCTGWPVCRRVRSRSRSTTA